MPTTTNGLLGKLLAIQTEGIEGVTKDAKNPHFKNTYISLGKLVDAVVPALNKHGLVLIQNPTDIEGAPALTTIVADAETGDSIESTTPLMLERDNPQGLGSAITYVRRYAIMSILSLVADEDDDGEKASPVRERKVVNKAGSDSPDKPLF